MTARERLLKLLCRTKREREKAVKIETMAKEQILVIMHSTELHRVLVRAS